MIEVFWEFNSDRQNKYECVQQTRPMLPLLGLRFRKHNSPLLHFAVGVAGVVDEASNIAHAISIDDRSSVEIQAVMMVLL